MLSALLLSGTIMCTVPGCASLTTLSTGLITGWQVARSVGGLLTSKKDNNYKEESNMGGRVYIEIVEESVFVTTDSEEISVMIINDGQITENSECIEVDSSYIDAQYKYWAMVKEKQEQRVKTIGELYGKESDDDPMHSLNPDDVPF